MRATRGLVARSGVSQRITPWLADEARRASPRTGTRPSARRSCRTRGWGTSPAASRASHLRLVAGRGDRVGRAVGEPEPGAGRGGDDDALVVDRDDRVDAPAVDPAASMARTAASESASGTATARSPVAEHRRLLGSDHQLDARAPWPPRRSRGPGRWRWARGEVPGASAYHGAHDRRLTALLTITDPARERILEVRAGEPEPETLALWLEVSGVRRHRVHLRHVLPPRSTRPASDDVVQHGDDLSVVVPEEHADNIRGSTLDLSGGGHAAAEPEQPAGGAADGGRRPTSTSRTRSSPRSSRCSTRRSTRRSPRTAASPSSSRSRARSPTCAWAAAARVAAWPRSRCRRASRSRSSTPCPRSPRSSTSPTTPSGTNPYYEAAKK